MFLVCTKQLNVVFLQTRRNRNPQVNSAVIENISLVIAGQKCHSSSKGEPKKKKKTALKTERKRFWLESDRVCDWWWACHVLLKNTNCSRQPLYPLAQNKCITGIKLLSQPINHIHLLHENKVPMLEVTRNRNDHTTTYMHNIINVISNGKESWMLSSSWSQRNNQKIS